MHVSGATTSNLMQQIQGQHGNHSHASKVEANNQGTQNGLDKVGQVSHQKGKDYTVTAYA